MKRLSPSRGLELLLSVTSKHDPFTDCLKRVLPFRRLFFPTNGCELFPNQWKAVFDSQKMLGQSGMVVLPSELPVENWDDLGCWEIVEESEYWELRSTGCFAIENSIVDVQAGWVVQVSQESHALIGGIEEFGRCLTKCHASLQDEACSFREHWRLRGEKGESSEWAEVLFEACRVP